MLRKVMDPQIQQKLEEIHKDIKKIKSQMFWGRIWGILVVVVPLGLFTWLLPKFLNNFIQAYLPDGSTNQSVQQLLKDALQQNMK